MKQFITSLLVILCSLSAFAWREGNGGDAVKMRNQFYLLDLVEAGHHKAFPNSNTPVNPHLNSEILSWAKEQPVSVPAGEIIQKLSEIYAKNSPLGAVLLLTLKQLDWHWVDSPLRDVADEEPLIIVPKTALTQAALRINLSIYIQNDVWNRMNERNQTALVLHEIIFSLMQPDRNGQGIDRNSSRVRRLIGHLFSPQFEIRSLDNVLTTEAPQLSFNSFPEPSETVFWQKASSSVMYSFQLVATHEVEEPQIENKISLDNYVQRNKWIKENCSLYQRSQKSMLLSLQSDSINVQMRPWGEGDSEEFYLFPAFSHSMTNGSLRLEKGLSPSECFYQIQTGIESLFEKIDRKRP